MANFREDETKVRDQKLDAVVGKTIAALWVTDSDKDYRYHEILHIRTTDGLEIDLGTEDGESYSSWLDLLSP